MGTLEREIRQRDKKAFIKKAVLNSIAVAGVLSLALLAPNAIQLLKPFVKKQRKKYIAYSISQAVSRLQKQNLIYFEQTSRGKFVRLTEKGEQYLRAHIDEMPKPKRWDGKWRILVFDIKENKRRIRDQLRISLTRIGFEPLQRSVWVYPYDCEDFIFLLKADFKIGKEILYIVADKIENDSFLKNIFGLK